MGLLADIGRSCCDFEVNCRSALILSLLVKSNYTHERNKDMQCRIGGYSIDPGHFNFTPLRVRTIAAAQEQRRRTYCLHDSFACSCLGSPMGVSALYVFIGVPSWTLSGLSNWRSLRSALLFVNP